MSKLQAIWTCLTNFKPKIVKTVEIACKALYILNSILNSAIDTAAAAGLNVTVIEKIGSYVDKILSIVNKLADYLGIAVNDEFKNEVSALVYTDEVKFKKLTVKRSKATLADVMQKYDSAFDKLDSVLDD